MRTWALLGAAALLATACGTGEDGRSAVDGHPAAEDAAWIEMGGSPLSPRHDPWTAVVDDRVILVGGRDTPACPPGADCGAPSTTALQDGASYDPSNRTWSPVPRAPIPVEPSGDTVTARGAAWSLQGTRTEPVLLGYDAGSQRWQTEPVPAPAGRRLATLDGRIVVFPGSHESGGLVPDRLFDPGSRVWSDLPADPIGSAYDRSYVEVPAGLVLLAIPLTDVPPPDRPRVFHAAVLDRTTGAWSVLPPSAIAGYATSWFRSGSTVVNPTLGSADGGQVNPWDHAYAFGGVLDVEHRTWLPLPHDREVPVGAGSSPVASSDDTVISFVAGPPSPLVVLDLTSMGWSEIELPPGGLRTGPGVAITSRHVVVWGGADFESEPRGVLHADGWQRPLP